MPQDAFNSYDALNAYTMRCRAFHEGDLLVTFPSCKDPISCNPLFEAAAEYAKDPKASGRGDFTGRDHTILLRFIYGCVNFC